MISTKYNSQSVVRTRKFYVIHIIIMKIVITFKRLRVVYIICVETRGTPIYNLKHLKGLILIKK